MFRTEENGVHGVGQDLAVGALPCRQLPMHFARVEDAGFFPLLGDGEAFVVAGDPFPPGRVEVVPEPFFLGGLGQLGVFLPGLAIAGSERGDVFELPAAILGGQAGGEHGALGYPDRFAGDFDMQQVADGGQVDGRHRGQMLGNRRQAPETDQADDEGNGGADEESADKFYTEFEIAHGRPPRMAMQERAKRTLSIFKAWQGKLSNRNGKKTSARQPARARRLECLWNVFCRSRPNRAVGASVTGIPVSFLDSGA